MFSALYTVILELYRLRWSLRLPSTFAEGSSWLYRYHSYPRAFSLLTTAGGVGASSTVLKSSEIFLWVLRVILGVLNVFSPEGLQTKLGAVN